MKRKVLALTLVLALLFSAVAGAQVSLFAKANMYLPPLDPAITIISPTNGTYDVSTLSLEVTVKMFTGMRPVYVLRAPIIYTYTLDYRAPERISIANFSSAGIVSSFEGAANLKNLTEGLHSLKVHVGIDYRGDYEGGEDHITHTESEATVNFRIDSVPPEVVLVSLENKTYYTTDVPLNFTVNEPDTQVTYSLDGRENVTTVGNTILTNLSSGKHNITVYAEDTAGNVGFSETIRFNIEPFPTTLVIASVITVGVAGAGLTVYFKKRKR